MPKISIVVPVYNVSPYIGNCIDSLLRQTMKDIEIILVDDGSTDGSEKICDEYVALDERIRVIHKQNQGLSCARNDGIKAARAPYLMFVDGDDMVSPGFCEIPYQAAIRNDVALVAFRSYFVKNGKICKNNKCIPTGVVDVKTALKHSGVTVWNKLYKKELFNKISFPKGRVYEDVAVTHKFFFAANRIVLLPDFLYYYIYRKGSISRIKSSKNKRDGFISAIERANDLKKNKCGEDLYLPVLWKYALIFLARTNPSNDPVFRQAEQVVDSIKGIPSMLNWKKKLLLLMWKMNKHLFHFLCRALGLKDESL